MFTFTFTFTLICHLGKTHSHSTKDSHRTRLGFNHRVEFAALRHGAICLDSHAAAAASAGSFAF